MKLAWQLVVVNGAQCLLTDGDPKYGKDPTFLQSWGPDGRQPDVDPARTEPAIGPWEACTRDGAVITFAGNGKQTFVLIPK